MDNTYIQYKDTMFFVNREGKIWKRGTVRNGKGFHTYDNEYIPNKSGYKGNYLSVSVNTKHVYVHRMVAELFIPNIKNKPEVNHINNIHTDNRVENLEWATRQENAKHHMGENGCNREIYKNGSKKRKKKIINSLGEIFEGITDACDKYKLRSSDIVHVLKGKYKSCGGMAWKYYAENDSIPEHPMQVPEGYTNMGLYVMNHTKSRRSK